MVFLWHNYLSLALKDHGDHGTRRGRQAVLFPKEVIGRELVRQHSWDFFGEKDYSCGNLTDIAVKRGCLFPIKGDFPIGDYS